MSSQPSREVSRETPTASTAQACRGDRRLFGSWAGRLSTELNTALGDAGKVRGGRFRYIRAAVTAASSIIAKGVSTFSLLISLPLTVRYLGPERYGIWLELSSLVAIMAHLDFGLSNGLVNAVSAAEGKKDKSESARSVASAFFLLTSLAVLLGVVFAASYKFLPLQLVTGNITDEAAAEAKPALCVLVFCFLATMPLGIAERVQIGYQQGFRANLWRSAASALSLVLLLAFIRLKAGLPLLMLASAASLPLVSGLNCLYEFGRVRPHLAPRIANFRWASAKDIVSSGFWLCLGGLAAVLAAQAPFVLAGRFLGPSAVAEYGVTQRILSVLPLAMSMMMLPLWPAYREALASGDVPWISRTFRRTLLAAAVLAIIGLLLFWEFYGAIITHWIGESLVPAPATALALAVFTGGTCLKWTTWMCLNGCGRLRAQAIYPYPIILAGCVAAAVASRKYGLPGIVWCLAVTEYLIVALQSLEIRAMFQQHRNSPARQAAVPLSSAQAVPIRGLEL